MALFRNIRNLRVINPKLNAITKQIVYSKEISNAQSTTFLTSRNFLSTSCLMSQSQIATFEEVKAVKNNTEILLIDVREPNELNETGRIPGSINIPLGAVENVLKEMSPEDFSKTYGREKPTKNAVIIFSCLKGVRAEKARQTAIKLGYTKVKNYKGSWEDWAERIK